MNRRNFLKYLSSIPLIGIPVKLLAKEKSGWNGIIESRSNVSLHKSKIDPYEDVADIFQDAYRGYWPNGHDMNADWMQRVNQKTMTQAEWQEWADGQARKGINVYHPL